MTSDTRRLSPALKYGSVCILLLAVLIGPSTFIYHRRAATSAHLEAVLGGLLRAETAVGLDPDMRVAVGFGSCVDVIGPGLETIEKLGLAPPPAPEHFDIVRSAADFERVFAYFFRHGAAAERYMSNSTYFRTMAEAAMSLPDTRVVVGGNAPVMVNCFRRQGLRVLLGAQMTEDLRKRVGWDVEVAGDDVTEDDIHLILEYKRGERWGDYEAPRSNRFIVHNDANNPSLTALEKFSDALVQFAPQLIVISGLQMMDNFPYPPGQRRARLNKLSEILAAVTQETRVHFEMASFTEHDCLRDIIDTVVRYSDSLGMNEQELPNLLSVLLTDNITLVSDASPRVATTLDQMRQLYALLRDSTTEEGGRRKVTRLHVHTLAFQAIITQTGSAWKNSASAAAKASLAASRHVCGSPSVSVLKSRLLMDDSFSTSGDSNESRRIPFSSEEPVSCWTEFLGGREEGEGEEEEGMGGEEEEGGEKGGEGAGRRGGETIQICIAPVLICTNVVQTVGGGDNISSAGLVLQI